MRHITGIAVVLAGSLVAATLSPADELKRRGLSETPKVGTVKDYHADGSVDFELASGGERRFTKAEIDWVKVTPPDDLAQWMTASNPDQVTAAIQGLRPVADHLMGIPETQADPWVADAILKLGDFYVLRGDFQSAAALFEKFKSRYPAEIGRLANIGSVRALIGRHQYDDALKAIAAIVEPISKALTVSPKESAYYARAYIAQGDCHAAQQKWREALMSYLTVVVICYQDKPLLAQARYKAGQAYEQLADWERAAEVYAELLKEAPPQTAFLDDVKKRQAAAQEKYKKQGQP